MLILYTPFEHLRFINFNLGNMRLLFTLIFFIPLLTSAQQDHFKCGVTPETAALIKQRLMDNRKNIDAQLIYNQSTNRNITYIPLSINNVAGDATGVGKLAESAIFAFLCGLNEIYLDQDVQFFIYNNILNRVSNNIHLDASSNASRSNMVSYKVGGTLNIVIGSSINNQVASWYDGFGDFVFLLKSMVTPEAKTEAHEIGHFFTLNHTFYGWEGIDVEADYGGGNVPSSIGSGWSQFYPEAAPRTGPQANCTNRGDGFCDTEADYYSDRKNCPYVPTVKDPYGNDIDPDESNMMSYAFDNCVTNFTTEQKNAIAADILARNWISQTPSNTAEVTGTPAPVHPVNNDTLGSITDPTMRLDWTDVPNADMYFVEVVSTLIPGVNIPNTSDVIFSTIVNTGNSHVDIPSADFVANNVYAWRLKALNPVSTCAPITGWSKFQPVVRESTGIDELGLSSLVSMNILNNPIQSSNIQVSLQSGLDIFAQLSLYDLSGKEIMQLNEDLLVGTTQVQMPVSDLPNGVYMLILSTEKGLLQEKLIIQK
jgi:hypothetical protein